MLGFLGPNCRVVGKAVSSWEIQVLLAVGSSVILAFSGSFPVATASAPLDASLESENGTTRLNCHAGGLVMQSPGPIHLSQVFDFEPVVNDCAAGSSGAIVVIQTPRFTMDQSTVIRLPDGADGPLVTRTIADGSGETVFAADGGSGWSLMIRSDVAVLAGTVELGDGGRGGSVVVLAQQDTRVIAHAGSRGPSGQLVLDLATRIGELAVAGGRGGDGGDAVVQRLCLARCDASDSSPGDRTSQGDNGTSQSNPDGGDAVAEALSGACPSGHGGNASAHGGHGAARVNGGGRAGNATVSAGDGCPGDTGVASQNIGTGGDGGWARAVAGHGGPGPDPGDGGAAWARGGVAGGGAPGRRGPGGAGGSGGWAEAVGRDGGQGGGHGGAAMALGGRAGNGGNSTVPSSDGDSNSVGGPGGRGGSANAKGGAGTDGPSGGTGGNAAAVAGNGGHGGSGCDAGGRGDLGGSENAMGGLSGDGAAVGGSGGSAQIGPSSAGDGGDGLQCKPLAAARPTEPVPGGQAGSHAPLVLVVVLVGIALAVQGRPPGK